MKRLAILCLLILCLPLSARADEAGRRAKAQEMLNLLHLDRTITQVMDSVIKQVNSMSSQMSGKQLPPEQKAKLDEFQKQVFAVIDSQIGWKAMEPEYVKLYAETYTDEELDAILAFYKSPSGQSMIAKTPELTQKSTVIVQQKMADLQPRIVQMVQDFAREASKTPAPPVKSN